MGKSRRSDRQSRDQESSHSFWISVSDLMAGLIFLFLIILTVFSIKFKKEQNEFISAKAELQSPAKTRMKILSDLKGMLKQNGLIVETLPEEGILRLTEQSLQFPAARAVPEVETLGNLGKLAVALTRVLPCFSSMKRESFIQRPSLRPQWCEKLSASKHYQCPADFSGSIETVMIEGHTDATTVRAGTGYRDNLSLSAARATTILRLLMQCDPRIGHLYNGKGEPLVGASGYSSLRPVIKNNPKDPGNRRIDIRFVMDLPENALETGTRSSAINKKGESL